VLTDPALSARVAAARIFAEEVILQTSAAIAALPRLAAAEGDDLRRIGRGVQAAAVLARGLREELSTLAAEVVSRMAPPGGR
jgi:hypothetical protein